MHSRPFVPAETSHERSRLVTITGILRDDLQTRARLVERPAEQLELLMHVLLTQGTEVSLEWNGGRVVGDPALVAYIERTVVRPGDADIVVALVKDVLEARSIEISETESG